MLYVRPLAMQQLHNKSSLPSTIAWPSNLFGSNNTALDEFPAQVAYRTLKASGSFKPLSPSSAVLKEPLHKRLARIELFTEKSINKFIRYFWKASTQTSL